MTLRLLESLAGFCGVVDDVFSVDGFFKMGGRGGSGQKVSSRVPNQNRLWVS